MPSTEKAGHCDNSKKRWPAHHGGRSGTQQGARTSTIRAPRRLRAAPPADNSSKRGGRRLGGGGPVNPSTAFGLVLADELARCGLREVVVAPGSRSTPLAMAFWELDRAGRVRLHVRIDERSAAFTALGLAKVSRRPVAVLCTSGTAAANFHPAVIEADESGIPLLVLTAGRPSCGGSAPTRRSTRSSCTEARCAGSARSACRRRGREWPATGARWPARP